MIFLWDLTLRFLDIVVFWAISLWRLTLRISVLSRFLDNFLMQISIRYFWISHRAAVRISNFVRIRGAVRITVLRSPSERKLATGEAGPWRGRSKKPWNLLGAPFPIMISGNMKCLHRLFSNHVGSGRILGNFFLNFRDFLTRFWWLSKDFSWLWINF